MTRDSSQSAVTAAAGADTGATKVRYGWVVLAVCFLITTLTYAGSFSFGLFFKPLRAEFGWSSAQTSGVFSLFMFCYCMFGILTGVAVDRIGPRITLVAGGLCIGSGFLLSGMVHKLWQIYLSYGLLAGAGMSSVYGPVMTTASRWFQRKQGLALGVVSSGIGLGTFIGPLIFGHLIPMYGWRFSYLAAGTGIGSIMVLLGLLLRKDPVQAAERPEERNEAAAERRSHRSIGRRRMECLGSNPHETISALCSGLFHGRFRFADDARASGSLYAGDIQILPERGCGGFQRCRCGQRRREVAHGNRLRLSRDQEVTGPLGSDGRRGRGLDPPLHASVDALSIWGLFRIRIRRPCSPVPCAHTGYLRHETYGEEHRTYSRSFTEVAPSWGRF